MDLSYIHMPVMATVFYPICYCFCFKISRSIHEVCTEHSCMTRVVEKATSQALPPVIRRRERERPILN